MKKALAIAALVAAMFVAGNVQAQTTIYAAYAPETFKSTTTSFLGQTVTEATKYQGFAIGFNYNINLIQGLGVAPGAEFRMNMRSDTDSSMGITGKISETQTMIDVPVLINYQLDLTRDFAVVPFVGPMASFAISGVTKGSDPIFGSSTYDWYGENGYMQRFNLYAVFGVDVKYSKFNLFGGYRLGLLDVDTFNDSVLKTNGMFVGLGFSL